MANGEDIDLPCPNCGEELHITQKTGDKTLKSNLSRTQWSIVGAILVIIGPGFPWLWIPGFAIPGFRFLGTWTHFVLGSAIIGMSLISDYEDLWNWHFWIPLIGVVAALFQMVVLVHIHPPTEEYRYAASQISFGFYLTLIGYVPPLWFGSEAVWNRYL